MRIRKCKVLTVKQKKVCGRSVIKRADTPSYKIEKTQLIAELQLFSTHVSRIAITTVVIVTWTAAAVLLVTDVDGIMLMFSLD